MQQMVTVKVETTKSDVAAFVNPRNLEQHLKV